MVQIFAFKFMVLYLKFGFGNGGKVIFPYILQLHK